MGDLEHVLKAIERKKNPPRDVQGEILEEVRLVGTAVELQEHYRNLANIVNSLVGRIDKMESALNAQIGGIDIPVPPSLDGLQSALDALRGELAEALPLLAKEIKTAQESWRNVPVTQIPEYPRTDLSPVHDDMDRLYEVMANMTVPAQVVREVVAEQPKKEFVFDVKRNRSGFIRSVEVKEK